MFEVQCEVSVIIWGTMSSAGVGGGRSSVFYQVQSEHSHLPGDFRVLRALNCCQTL